MTILVLNLNPSRNFLIGAGVVLLFGGAFGVVAAFGSCRFSSFCFLFYFWDLSQSVVDFLFFFFSLLLGSFHFPCISQSFLMQLSQPNQTFPNHTIHI